VRRLNVHRMTVVLWRCSNETQTSRGKIPQISVKVQSQCNLEVLSRESCSYRYRYVWLGLPRRLRTGRNHVSRVTETQSCDIFSFSRRAHKLSQNNHTHKANMTSSSLASFMRILQIENNDLRSCVIVSDNSKTHAATVQKNNNEDLTRKIPTSCNADLTLRRQDDILPPFERPCLLAYLIRWEDGAGSRRIVRDSLELNASHSKRREQRNSTCLSPVCPRRQVSIDAVP
jgi:hypothetical protein